MRVTNLVKGLAVAALITIGSLLPPGLHFVLGPLSPLIGGFAGGTVGRLNGIEAFALGGLEALVAGLGVGFIFPVVAHLSLSTATLWFFGGVAALYAGVLSGVAAYFAGRMATSRR